MPRCVETAFFTKAAEQIGIPDKEIRAALGIPLNPSQEREVAIATIHSFRPGSTERNAAIRCFLAHYLQEF